MYLQQNYMQNQTLQRIIVDDGMEAEDGDSKLPHLKHQHGYNVGTTIAEKLETDQPILLVRLKDSRFGIIFSGIKFLFITDSDIKYVLTIFNSRLFSLNINFQNF